jgi:hypothetical protein
LEIRLILHEWNNKIEKVVFKVYKRNPWELSEMMRIKDIGLK